MTRADLGVEVELEQCLNLNSFPNPTLLEFGAGFQFSVRPPEFGYAIGRKPGFPVLLPNQNVTERVQKYTSEVLELTAVRLGHYRVVITFYELRGKM